MKTEKLLASVAKHLKKQKYSRIPANLYDTSKCYAHVAFMELWRQEYEVKKGKNL